MVTAHVFFSVPGWSCGAFPGVVLPLGSGGCPWGLWPALQAYLLLFVVWVRAGLSLAAVSGWWVVNWWMVEAQRRSGFF